MRDFLRVPGFHTTARARARYVRNRCITGLVFPLSPEPERSSSSSPRPCGQALRPHDAPPAASVSGSCSPRHAAPSRGAAALGLAHDCEPGVSGFQFSLLTQRLFVPPVSDIQGSFLNIFFSKLCFTFVSMETSLEMLSKSRVIQQIFIFWKILLHFRKPVWGQKARRDSVSLRNHLLPVKRACGAELLP